MKITVTKMICAVTLGSFRLLQDESGQDLIEYALVAALVGLAAVASINGTRK